MTAVVNRGDIQQRLRPHLPQLRKRYGVTALSLFGSYSRGEQSATSDVDTSVSGPRLYRDYLYDMVDAAKKALRFLGDLAFDDFAGNAEKVFATTNS